jgi:1-acyl-sn-glycerol-3-phosphate acyltransferase
MSLSWQLRVLTFYAIISITMFLFFVFVGIPIQLIGAPYSWRYKMAEIFSYIFVYLMWGICGIKFEVEGLEKLPKDGKPYLALANHQSFWENFFMQLIIPVHSWVIKKELLDVPIFGRCLQIVRPIAVDRSNNRSVLQILDEGAVKIESGLSIMMFPEATRIATDKSVKFKPSAAKLALNTESPIALIVHNAGLFWPKGFWFKKEGTIKVKVVEFMPAKKVAKYDVRELTDYIENKINTEKNKLV